MKKTIKVFFGILYGLAPFGAAAILGLVFYEAFPNIIGILTIIVLSIGALITGLFIFKRVMINGPLDFLSHIHASSEHKN